MVSMTSSENTPAATALSTPPLSPLERSVLAAVAELQARESRGLSDLLGHRQIVISAVLKSLLGKGLLFRKKNPDSRRGFIYGTKPFRE